MKKTLIIGASENPDRYANKAAHRLLFHGHPIELLGLRAGKIADRPIQTGQPTLDGIDTVTMYVGPPRQPVLYEYVLSLKPKRIIFNPGAENPEFQQLAEQQGIKILEACTLVLLATEQF
ncbi:MAG: CoA-binding protein [Cytophagaceae bacterium]|nr:CoA-binding protein [Cytophagaceae bacterium]